MEESDIANIPREGETAEEVFDSVDKELQEEAPADPQPEKPEKLELPDTHVLKQNETWEKMRKDNEALQERLEKLEKGDDNVIEVEESEFVTALVGENAEVTKKWHDEKQSLKEEMKREILQEQIDAQKKDEEQRQYWLKWTDDRLSEVEKEFNVDFKADESKKNELSKIMLDYSPTDEQGNLDYKKGYNILTKLNKINDMAKSESTQVKKNVADATVSKETSVQKNKDYLTSQDLRGKDWRTVINS